MSGESLGMEVSTTWDLARRWRVISGSGDFTSESAEGKSPKHQVRICSEVDLSRKVQFDTSVYHIGVLPALAAPAYTRIDARIG